MGYSPVRLGELLRPQPGAEPTGYGLGRSGWVTARFGAGDLPDLELIERWIFERYKAVVPKKMAAAVENAAVQQQTG